MTSPPLRRRRRQHDQIDQATPEELEKLYREKRIELWDIPEYWAWADMNAKCEDPDHPEYPENGGRGITVYPPWREDFFAFLKDMGRAPRNARRTMIRRRAV
jgi:hypothetical protein